MCESANIGTIKNVLFSLVSAEKQIEFCCHLARGSLDPNEPLTYEYVKFVVDFKYFTHGKLLLQFTLSLPLSLTLRL